tara:strand:+ start:2226 stop:5711 length:3486 start_codon:yes stop_codon:yes gene_type:complete
MPKKLISINRFEGGINDYSDPRDIADQESPNIVNFDIRKVGRLRLLGEFILDGTVGELIGPNTGSAPSFDNLDWGNGEELFHYKTDTEMDGDVLPEQLIAFTDKQTSKIYLYNSSGNTWVIAGEPTDSNWKGLNAVLTSNLASTLGTDSSYYVADGVLRAFNTNYGDASYTGSGVIFKDAWAHTTAYVVGDCVDYSGSRYKCTVAHTSTDNSNADTGNPASATNSWSAINASVDLFGSSSLWIGHIKRDFLSGAQSFNKWTAVPAKVITPGPETFMSPSDGASGFGASSVVGGIDTTAGKFSFGAHLKRDEGDGTIKFLGRKLYITYTYDGTQESLPYEILTIGQTEMDEQVTAPTTNTLGYESYPMRKVEYGASTIYLRNKVHEQASASNNLKNWENDGELTVTDDTGQIQTLIYSTIQEATKYDVTRINKHTVDGTKTIDFYATNADSEIDEGDIFEITGVEDDDTLQTTTADEYLNDSHWICTAASSTFIRCQKYWADNNTAQSIANTGTVDLNPPTGTVKMQRGGSYLTGVTGWVDSGYCSINYVLASAICTDGGTYSVAPDTLTIDSPPAGGTTATATFSTQGADPSISVDPNSIVITNHGDGYTSPPDITISGGTGSGAEFTTSITGKLSTENMCAEYGTSGAPTTWAASDIAVNGWTDGVPNQLGLITYDPAGELEEQDENLGMRISLTTLPKGDGTIVDYAYGGPRLTHVNFYTNKYDASGSRPEQDDYAFLGSFDLIRGFIKPDGSAEAWITDATHSDQKTSFSHYFGTQPTENYQMRTGMFPDTQSIDMRCKTSVVLNRRVYAGNVLMKDEAGNEKHYPDRVLKSLPNQFDVFPPYDSLDVVVDDGDDIIKLESFGGKLLQFKSENLYVIDVTQMPEFLAGTFRYRGIPHKNSAAKTDDGIVFANKNGVFLYQGEGCVPISKGKIDDIWNGTSGFYSSANPPILAFLPDKNVCIITKGGSAEFLVYDFLTKGWTKGSGDRLLDRLRTGFFTMNDTLYQGIEKSGGSDDSTSDYKDIQFYKWDDSFVGSSSTFTDTCIWESKEYTMGDPSQECVVYNVQVSYKTSSGDTTDVDGKMYLIYNDGTGDVSPEELTPTTSFVGTNNKWKTVKFKTAVNRHCLTAKIKFESTSGQVLDSGFEINDISIVYRNKSTK